MLLPIIQQIALANESLGGGSIVVLSSVPKNTLEKLIEAENMNLYESGSSFFFRTHFMLRCYRPNRTTAFTS